MIGIFAKLCSVFPTGEYAKLLGALAHTLLRISSPEDTRRRRMACVLFLRPESKLAKTSVIPHLGYFHCRSGESIDIFCAGYTIDPDARIGDGDDGNNVIQGSEGKKWSYSDERFNDIRIAFEERSTWTYSGNVDLLLFNAHLEEPTKEAVIEFDSAIICELGAMINSGAIDTVEGFLEQICRYSERNDDPTTSGFSKEIRMESAQASLWRGLLSVLPRGVGDDIRKARCFETKDVSLRSDK